MIAQYLLAAWLTFAPDGVDAAIQAANVCHFNEALGLLDRAEDFQKKSGFVRQLRARLLIQLGRGNEALRELDALPEESQFYSKAEHQLMRALAAASAARFEEARKALSAARRFGGDADLLDGALGMMFVQEGQLERGETLLRSVLARKGAESMTGAVFNLAIAVARRGRDFEAAGLLRLAWHLGKRNPRALKEEKAFEHLVASGALIEDLLADEAGARCDTW